MLLSETFIEKDPSLALQKDKQILRGLIVHFQLFLRMIVLFSKVRVEIVNFALRKHRDPYC